MTRLRASLCLVLVGLTLAGALLVPSGDVRALPIYAQRSGHTCGNCHVSPTLEDAEGWENPDLSDRKCTLSCVGCHTNPTGGGLRNTSGRYYGQSTVAMLPKQDRSYSDLARELFSDERIWEFKQKRGAPPVTGDDGRTIPSDEAEAEAGVGAGQTGARLQWGKPLGGHHTMAFWDGRYDDLNADPAVWLGADLRAAYWSGSNSVFPMQLDLAVGVHPVHRVTFSATLGASRDPRYPVFARNAFVLLHELPGMSWVKGGVFLPAYGLYTDDHTSFTRDWFEMDIGDPANRVLGVEVGTAPNYPYASFSVFRNAAAVPVDDDTGWGMAVMGGWRDLGWGIGGHAMVKQRRGEGRGDLYAAGVQWSYTPLHIYDRLPLTLQGEASLGYRVLGNRAQRHVALMQEAWWTVRNGLSVRGKVDIGAHDAGKPGAWQHRYSLGLEVAPIPGVSLTPMVRALWMPSAGTVNPDVLLLTHFWF